MNNNKPKSNRKGDKNKISKMDICQTPPHALEPLYPHLERNGFKTIWESAVGPEHLLENALITHGYVVHGTDLLYGDIYNRFTYKIAIDYDIEITNIPFSIKYEWLARAFMDNKPFALLAPYETSFAEKFQRLFHIFNNNPWPIEVLSPERRINYKMPEMGWGVTIWDEKKQKYVKRGESAQMPTAWITWGLEIYKTRADYLRTYYVPMRKVKYGKDNQEV